MLDYDTDRFEDIVAKDSRYAARAYVLLMDAFSYLAEKGKNVTAADIIEEFRETALDEFGPLAYCVLEEWGVKRCEDIGEMMFNLAEFGRISRSEGDTKESFLDGYDFREAFLVPFAPR